jgi:hypothetical protein
MAQANALTNRQREYREVYLRSGHWQNVRTLALERAEHRCQVCNAAKHLDVHHRTYERLGEERDADLTVLCRKCHDLFHDSGRQTQRASKAKKPKQRKKKRGVGYTAPKQKPQHRKITAENEKLHRIQVENRERQEAARRAREGRLAA